MVLQLQRARRLGRTMAWRGEFLYAPCESLQFSCAFCPFESCPFKAVTSCDTGEEAETSAIAFNNTFEDAWVPDDSFGECFRGPHALLRYVSALTGFLFRPSDAVHAQVKQLKIDMGLPQKYLGVHIRHGDACMGDGTETESFHRCFGIPTFAQALSSLSELYGITNVYLATDNPEAKSLLEQLLPGMVVHQNSQGVAWNT
jgi:hypothetical protein